MKDLHIPIATEKSIDLCEINPDFKGLIIGYKKDSAVGYIQYCDGEWCFLTSIDTRGNIMWDEILLEVIQELVKKDICTHFKVLEFAQC